MKTKQKTLQLSLLAVLSIGLVAVLQPAKVSAVTAADWKAGRIIDDAVFTNKDGMSAAQVQEFLNAKVPACDTWGTKPISAGSTQTRAEWAAANGKPAPPYTCLRDFYEVPKTQPGPGLPANNYGGKPIPAGARSGAQLIWDAAQAYSISPKVLLTTIQKESHGPLTTDDWPYEWFYTYAMGAHCPDSGPNGSANCDSNYAGFSIQIRESARLFRYYLDSMSQPWWPYKKPGVNNVLWNVQTTGCGGADINIETMATAALYTYTPYQPNQAALNNMYGTGDRCSAYGNRNFWRIYSDWFGRTTLDCRPDEVPYAEIMRAYNHATYKHFYTAYKCEIDVLSAKLGYKFEGTSFYQTSSSSPYAVVVHRLYNPTTQLHLWVTTQEEINSATQKSGYRYEGVAYYVVKPEVPGHVPVHRLYNPQTYLHLWVTTQEEINSATQHSGYRYEGVAFYAAPPPAPTTN